MAPSSPLPNSSDPGATLACACLNSGDLTATERSGAAAAVCFPGLIPSVRFRSNGPDHGIPPRARAPDALTHMSVSPAAAHPSRSDFLRPILIERLGPPRTRSDPPPSDLDRTVWTPVAACQCPSPLALDPLGQCWGEGEDATLRSMPSSIHCTNGGKMTSAAHPSSYSLQDEGLRRSLSIPRPHQTGGPRGIRPIVTGPTQRSVLWARFVIAFL
jgi:hypothetical protein